MKALSAVFTVVLIAVSLSAAGVSSAEETKVKTLYMFLGAGGAGAYTIDRTGANLPEQYAPWRFIKQISTSGPTFSGGADAAALREVKATGLSVRVFSVSLEPDAP